jgi:hypothetical protein
MRIEKMRLRVYDAQIPDLAAEVLGGTPAVRAGIAGA